MRGALDGNFSANPGKNLIRAVDGVDYLRIPVKTHLITKDDDMVDVVNKYPKDKMQPGDILFISEKAVACTQSRAIPMEDTNPGSWQLPSAATSPRPPPASAWASRRPWRWPSRSAAPCASCSPHFVL